VRGQRLAVERQPIALLQVRDHEADRRDPLAKRGERLLGERALRFGDLARRSNEIAPIALLRLDQVPSLDLGAGEVEQRRCASGEPVGLEERLARILPQPLSSGRDPVVETGVAEHDLGGMGLRVGESDDQPYPEQAHSKEHD
jgi:hypothetical protein